MRAEPRVASRESHVMALQQPQADVEQTLHATHSGERISKQSSNDMLSQNTWITVASLVSQQSCTMLCSGMIWSDLAPLGR